MNPEDLKLRFINFTNKFRFPDGTLSIRAEAGSGTVIAMQGFSLDELFIKHSAVTEAGLLDRPVLYAPYIPARQDRICNEGEPFTVRVIADAINYLNFAQVITLEPHSDVLPGLIKRCKTLTYEDVFDFKTIECLNTSAPLNIVAPDAGAIKRTEKFIQSVLKYNPEKQINLIQGIKRRNIQTGEILSIEIDQEKVEGECLVVDDVCAKGGTFKGIFNALREAGAGEINLILAHADESNGLDDLAKKFKNIYVTNSQNFTTKKENIQITNIV